MCVWDSREGVYAARGGAGAVGRSVGPARVPPTAVVIVYGQDRKLPALRRRRRRASLGRALLPGASPLQPSTRRLAMSPASSSSTVAAAAAAGPSSPSSSSHERRDRVTVLISGSGPSPLVSRPLPGRPPLGSLGRPEWTDAHPLQTSPGSNLQALMDASRSGELGPADITHVISNRSLAYGLTRAREHSPAPIPTSVLALKTFQSRQPGASRADYDGALAEVVLSERPDLVVLAGFMHILSPTFLESLPASLPIINLHPALPGQFDGARAIPRAKEAFERGEVDRTGVMVHRVVAEVDRGKPVCVREVEMRKGETLEQLEERIHAVEHGLIVEGARTVLEELRQARRAEKEGQRSSTTPAAAAVENEDRSRSTTTTAADPRPSSDVTTVDERPSTADRSPSSAVPLPAASKLDEAEKTGLESLVDKLRIGKPGAAGKRASAPAPAAERDN
jgi:phosphoribosylglycinamide formyltransferase